jgi:hypothetical protein
MADKNATTLAAIWAILGVMLDEEFTLEEKLDRAREIHALASIEIEELESETTSENMPKSFHKQEDIR